MKNEKKDFGKILFQWDFPEFETYQRPFSWYVIAGLVAVLLLIYAFVTVNFLFAVIIVMLAVVFIYQYTQQPETKVFKIMEDGLSVDELFFPYEQIRNFYIIYNPPEVKKIFVEFNSVLKPRLAIPLENQVDPLEIRQALLKFIEEDLEKNNEPLSEGLSKIFKL